MNTLFDNETILKGYTREKENAAMNEGIRKNKVETANKMLKKAMSIDLIAEVCGLSLTEINELKAQLAN